VTVAVVVLAVLSGGRLGAQGTPQSTAEYRQIVERLAERWRRLAEAESLPPIGSAGMGSPRLDTLRFGAFTLIVPPARASIAAAVGRAAWDSVKAVFGADTVALLPHVIAVDDNWGRPGHFPSAPRTPRERQESYGRSVLLTTVRDAETARLEADGAAGPWFASVFWGMLYAPDSLQRVEAYLELATRPWAVVRACYEGDLEACRRALAVVADPDSVASRFTPAERRHLVEQRARRWSELQRAPGTARCVEAEEDSACVDLFGRFPQVLHEEPLSSEARATLLRTAADLGGDGWYSRLLSSSEPDYLARLSAVAEVPPEALLAQWRTRTMSAKPRPMTLTRLSGWVAFLWAAIFVVAATRSSRWRRE